MTIYEIQYLDGTDIKSAYVRADGIQSAGRNFTKLLPDVDIENVFSVEAFPKETTPNMQQIKIYDIDMPFGSIVHFMTKCVLATIPVTIIIFFIFRILTGFF